MSTTPFFSQVQKRIVWLMRRQAFAFVSPLSLEECAEVLLSQSERKPGILGDGRDLRVQIQRITYDSYRFRLHRYARNRRNNRLAQAEVRGTLIASEIGTLVEGHGDWPLFLRLSINSLLVTSVLVGFIAFMQPLCVLWIALWIVPAIETVWLTALERDRLIQLTFEVLG